MTRLLSFAAPAVVTALVLAGCASPPPTAFKAHGASPVMFMGYDYAGASAVPGQGAADVSVDFAKDTGTASFTFTGPGGAAFSAQFTRFMESPGKAFQQGGVRDDFPEHGNTGNGDAMLPTIHALSAGWGVGTVTLNGQPLTDPTTGQPQFALHYMVTDTGPRDPATHKVTKADGSTPYDPASPTDAKVTQAKEIMLNIQSMGAAPPPTNATFSVTGTIAQPMTDETKPAFTIDGPGATVNITYALQGPAPGAPPVGQATFELKADNKTVDTCAVQLPPADPTAPASGCTHTLASAPAGAYTVHVTGDGVGTPYTVSGTVTTPVEPTFLHVVYGDVTIG